MLPTQSCDWDYRVMWLDPPSEWCEWTPDNVTFRALKKRNISTTTHLMQINEFISNFCSSCVMCKSVRQNWFTKNHVILVIVSGLPIFSVFWEAISVPIRRGFPEKIKPFLHFLVLVTHYKVRPAVIERPITWLLGTEKTKYLHNNTLSPNPQGIHGSSL